LTDKKFGKINVATWNVREIAEKKEILKTELLKRKIDIAIITETKKKNIGSEDIGNYVMIYCVVPAKQRASSGVQLKLRKMETQYTKIHLDFGQNNWN